MGQFNRALILQLEISDDILRIVLRVQDLVCHRIENKWAYTVSLPMLTSCTFGYIDESM